MSHTQDLEQKQRAPIALVTGSSRGLGRSMALHLAERGVDVIVTYKSARAGADAVVAAIREKGRRAVALELDASDSASFHGFRERVGSALREHFGATSFDYLVQNAGLGVHAPFAETTEEQLDELYRVHFKAPFLLTQRLLPLLSDGGRILNVSSGLARFTFPGYAAYASMKGAVEVLTRYMAKELAARKITVNVLAPGAIETDFGGGAVRDNPDLNKGIAAATALGRVGLPDDIGAAVALLLSDGATWITGQRVEVSGGMML